MSYHQIELHTSCRDITMFVTSCGLFHFKRLMLGISAAYEAFHHIINQVFEGCEGAHNTSEDIIIVGKGQGLEDVLTDLRERGLTVNGS